MSELPPLEGSPKENGEKPNENLPFKPHPLDGVDAISLDPEAKLALGDEVVVAHGDEVVQKEISVDAIKEVLDSVPEDETEKLIFLEEHAFRVAQIQFERKILEIQLRKEEAMTTTQEAGAKAAIYQAGLEKSKTDAAKEKVRVRKLILKWGPWVLLGAFLIWLAMIVFTGLGILVIDPTVLIAFITLIMGTGVIGVFFGYYYSKD